MQSSSSRLRRRLARRMQRRKRFERQANEVPVRVELHTSVARWRAGKPIDRARPVLPAERCRPENQEHSRTSAER